MENLKGDNVRLVFYGHTVDGKDLWVWSDGVVDGDIVFERTLFGGDDGREETYN